MPQGVVKHLNHEKGFGFIRYASQPGATLDTEALFKNSDLVESVFVGSVVDFIVEETERGPRAHDIVPIVIPRFKGVVSSAGPCKYGFIRGEDGREIFYSHKDVVPDLLGRRGMPVGTLCSFEIDLNPSDKHKHEHATNVRNEDPALAQIVDPENYREIGKVRRWEGAEGTVKRGRIERPDGDSILFGGEAVVSEGLEDIRLGTHVEYSLDIRLFLFDLESEVFYHRVSAREVLVCERRLAEPSYESGSAEEFFMSVSELPTAEAPVIPRKDGEIYTPAERKCSIRELIARKKSAA